MVRRNSIYPQFLQAIKDYGRSRSTIGFILLPGLQKFHLMRDTGKILADRVAILDLLGFAQAEIQDQAVSSLPFLPTDIPLSRTVTAIPVGHL